MAIDITADDEELIERWDDYVDRSPNGTLFHTHDFLEVLARHSDTGLHLLGGYKGQEPVGIFPVFHDRLGPVDTVFSPPRKVGMFQLGPALLNAGSPKQRRREKRCRRFVEGCLDWIDDEIDPSYSHFRTYHEYDDVRPFKWEGFDLSPRFNYVVDLDASEEDLLMEFSSDARSNIRRMRDQDCTVEEGGPEGVRAVISQVTDRFGEQNKASPVDVAYVIDLYESLPAGQVRSYVCTVEGEFATGMVTLEGEDSVYRWQGGVRPAVDLPVNEYLDWRIIQDARDRGKTRYNLVGANTKRLTEYKSKFNPRVVEYYTVVGGARWAVIAADAYEDVPGMRSVLSKVS